MYFKWLEIPEVRCWLEKVAVYGSVAQIRPPNDLACSAGFTP